MFRNLTLGERLSSLRQEKKMTQKDLAIKLNVSDKTISKWETSENEPSLSDIQKLSEIFNVSLDLILKGVSTGNNDDVILKNVFDMKKCNEANQEINNFYKKECPYKEEKIDDLFIVIDNKPYAILESILALDDFDFYNKVNENFTFVKVVKKQNNFVVYSELDESSEETMVYLPHPYILTLDDLKNNNSLEFFEFVVNNLEEKYKKETEEFQERRKLGYGVGLKPATVECQLSNYLDKMEINDIEDDKVYEKIIYLIEHGAVLYDKIPSGNGTYSNVGNITRTDIMYKMCADHIRFINEIDELKEKIDMLKTQTKK